MYYAFHFKQQRPSAPVCIPFTLHPCGLPMMLQQTADPFSNWCPFPLDNCNNAGCERQFGKEFVVVTIAASVSTAKRPLEKSHSTQTYISISKITWHSQNYRKPLCISLNTVQLSQCALSCRRNPLASKPSRALSVPGKWLTASLSTARDRIARVWMNDSPQTLATHSECPERDAEVEWNLHVKTM